MKIIALVGPSSCGKTSTLNLVYDDLIGKGAISSGKHKVGGNPSDFEDILTWKGKQVAFYTMGDYSGHIVNATRYYYGLKCHIFVCACNDRFARPIYEFKNPVYHYIPMMKIPQRTVALQTADNTAQALTIVSLI